MNQAGLIDNQLVLSGNNCGRTEDHGRASKGTACVGIGSGKILLGGSEIQCTVRNLSRLGACLVLLRHEFLRCDDFAITELQHGHRGRLLTSAPINRRRMVAIEFGM